MTKTQSHRAAPQKAQPLLAGRTLRLLLCAFLFTAAAVCKNVLPEGYRQALVTGLDAGPGVGELAEMLGTGGVQAALARLRDAGVRSVFRRDTEGTDAAAPGDAAEAAAETGREIPVLSHREISVDAGELPPEETAEAPREDAAQETPPEEAAAEETPADDPAGSVRIEAYALPASDAGLPVPDAVLQEAVSMSMDYVSPVRGTLTSGFGYRTHPIDGEYKFHYGVDLAVPQGTEVRCFADGEVSFTGWGDINGYYVKVEHEDGFSTLYAHLERILVREGDRVGRGDTLALSGATGEASGPHLHFQLYWREKLIDPTPFVDLEA